MSTPALDQFRTELLAAAEQRRSPATRPSRRPHRRVLVLGLATLAVLGGGTAAAVTLTSQAPDDPYDPAVTSPTVFGGPTHPLSRAERAAIRRRENARAPVLDARRYFAVLARPATDADRVPRRTDQSGIRLAATGPLGRVFIRSTPRRVCALSVRGQRGGTTGTCVPTAVARTRGAVVFEQCFKTGPPQHRYLVGVVPDGVSTVSVSRRGVRQASATVQHNGFILDTAEPFDTLRVGRTRTAIPPVAC